MPAKLSLTDTPTTPVVHMLVLHQVIWPAVQRRLPYHVRVCVPCYKEDLEILRRTVLAAHDAILPNGCQRTIYMCDDGKDPKKRKW